MFSAIASLTVLGALLGLGLGVAARKFAVEGDPLADVAALQQVRFVLARGRVARQD